MKGFITIVAASAVLSASLCAGLAASDTAGRTRKAVAAPVPATQAPAQTTWVDPPAKVKAETETACRDAAWPYRGAPCAVNAAPVRKVRVIPAAVPAAVAQR